MQNRSSNKRHKQGPEDPAETGFRVFQDFLERTGEERPKDPLAVELGRRGGLKGGKARAEKLSPEQRREIAQKAAAARWKSKA